MNGPHLTDIGGTKYYEIYYHDLTFDSKHRMLRFKDISVEKEFRKVFYRKHSVVVRGRLKDVIFYWHCNQNVDKSLFAIYTGVSEIDERGAINLFLVVDITTW